MWSDRRSTLYNDRMGGEEVLCTGVQGMALFLQRTQRRET